MQLAVSDEVEWLGVQWNTAADEAGDLFEPAAIEHPMDALLDAFVERGARRLEADLHGRVSLQARSPGPVDFGNRPSSAQADFDCANHLGAIAGADAQSGLGVQTPQDTMQVLEAVFVRARFQPRSQFLRASGGVGQAFEKRTEIKSRANRKDREPGAMAQVLESGNPPDTIFPRRKSKAGVHQVKQVVCDDFALFMGRFGGADVKAAIDLRGIAR